MKGRRPQSSPRQSRPKSTPPNIGSLYSAKERDIQRDIKAYLQVMGYFVYKNHQSLGSHRGVADLTAIRQGRVIWIEVKTPRGNQSSYQREFEAEITEHGGEYMVARSLDDVIAYVERVRGLCAG